MDRHRSFCSRGASTYRNAVRTASHVTLADGTRLDVTGADARMSGSLLPGRWSRLAFAGILRKEGEQCALDAECIAARRSGGGGEIAQIVDRLSPADRVT